MEKLSSYGSTDGTGTPLNQVVYEFNDLSALAKENQAHSGAKDGNTPAVQYNYDTAATNGIFTSAYRPSSIVLPSTAHPAVACGRVWNALPGGRDSG